LSHRRPWPPTKRVDWPDYAGIVSGQRERELRKHQRSDSPDVRCLVHRRIMGKSVRRANCQTAGFDSKVLNLSLIRGWLARKDSNLQFPDPESINAHRRATPRGVPTERRPVRGWKQPQTVAPNATAQDGPAPGRDRGSPAERAGRRDKGASSSAAGVRAPLGPTGRDRGLEADKSDGPQHSSRGHRCSSGRRGYLPFLPFLFFFLLASLAS